MEIFDTAHLPLDAARLGTHNPVGFVARRSIVGVAEHDARTQKGVDGSLGSTGDDARVGIALDAARHDDGQHDKRLARKLLQKAPLPVPSLVAALQ